MDDSYKGELEKKIKEISKQYYDKLSFEYIDLSAQPNLIAEAQEMKVTGITVEGQSYYCSLILSKDDKFENINVISPIYDLFGQIRGIEFKKIDDIETTINDTLTSVLEVNEKIGFLNQSWLVLSHN